MDIDYKDSCAREGKSIDLKKWPTEVKPYYQSKKQLKKMLRARVEKMSDMQSRLYASNRYAVLLIFQAMDAAGKDSAIKHVMSGVNPQGCQVFSFKHPSLEELDHDFLWRTLRCLPERGRIGIFNRSYYEEVLVVRVHPELLEAEGLPDLALDKRISGTSAIGRSSTWRLISTAMGRESSNFFSIFPKRNNASGFSRVSTSPIKIGSSVWLTLKNENIGMTI